MILHDQKSFLNAAEKFGAWIFVRETNPRSFQYVRGAVYQPKPISCKPKTADLMLGYTNKKVDGLVTDPVRWPEAFSPAKLTETLDLWHDFRRQYCLGEFLKTSNGFTFLGKNSSPLGFAIDTNPLSKHEGCVTFGGKYLCGDYDLFAVVLDYVTPKHVGKDKILVPAGAANIVRPLVFPEVTGPRGARDYQIADFRDQRWSELSAFLNQQMGFPMIQHGSQCCYKPNSFGNEKRIYAFGPEFESGQLWTARQVQLKFREWKII
jgi:hypothetical protein